MSTRPLLMEALALKALPRAGWSRVGIDKPESVAAHSWGVAWLGMVLCPPELDRERVLSLAIIHDLVEVRVGDITPHDGITPAEKQDRELRSARLMFADRLDLLTLWEEYADHETAESRFVHELDKLDMALQANHYRESQQAGTAEFRQSARARISTPELLALMDP